MNTAPNPAPSLPSLLRELRDETTHLLRQEVNLAKTEVKENVSHLGSDFARVAIGAFVAYAGIIVLLLGVSQLIAGLLIHRGVDPLVAQWVAPGALGLAVAVIGCVMVNRARHALSKDHLLPHQTIASLKSTKDWAHDKIHQS